MTLHRLRRDDDATIHYAWDRALPPVLRIQPGDEVLVETRSGEDGQLRPGDSAEALSRLDRSRLHALSGPIEVAGATPGGALTVEVLELAPGAFGFTMQRPGAGLIEGFPHYLRFYDCGQADEAELAPGIRVPIRPFLGVMGVAPADGRRSTIAPGDHGGNLDCRDLVTGSTLHLPVQVPGALFSCGDGHAAQGDGEVCVTAIECAMTARLRFGLRDEPLRRPRIETLESLMTVGAAPTLEEASRQALEDMLDLIVSRTRVGRADAYALASIAVDLRINQVVNRPMMGVRAVLPRAVIGA